MSLCECMTLKGVPCKSFKKRGTNYCSSHQNCQKQQIDASSSMSVPYQSSILPPANPSVQYAPRPIKPKLPFPVLLPNPSKISQSTLLSKPMPSIAKGNDNLILLRERLTNLKISSTPKQILLPKPKQNEINDTTLKFGALKISKNILSGSKRKAIDSPSDSYQSKVKPISDMIINKDSMTIGNFSIKFVVDHKLMTKIRNLVGGKIKELEISCKLISITHDNGYHTVPSDDILIYIMKSGITYDVTVFKIISSREGQDESVILFSTICKDINPKKYL